MLSLHRLSTTNFSHRPMSSLQKTIIPAETVTSRHHTNDRKMNEHMKKVKENWQDQMWDAYNFLMKCPDVSRLQKILVRHDLFRMSLDVPGDIVECGVFKGTGLMQLLKMRQIHIPSSMKKIIGFDLFREQPKLTGDDDRQMTKFFSESSFTGIDPDTIMHEASLVCNNDVTSCIELVPGDVCISCKHYADSKPGFRISLLYMDLDVEEATLRALEALWPRVVRGGVVVFDEYAVAKWSESNAVDEFLKNKPEQKMRTIQWSKSPTAYIIKQ
ncbi:uncharacterized protein LOC117107184 isoform X2 [Anneissia japonica]|uniref:uncharacterized protein LOC117107184 isoform X2 n=1 Tax=Anneissia japonica TaxID=1529436 RepID=UPI001425AC36|nr:uncharacterized protein LOC117107184 isoform X2 [Anneissia japonica]